MALCGFSNSTRAKSVLKGVNRAFFGRLLRDGWIELDDLEGLYEDKITKIKKIADSILRA